MRGGSACPPKLDKSEGGSVARPATHPASTAYRHFGGLRLPPSLVELRRTGAANPPCALAARTFHANCTVLKCAEISRRALACDAIDGRDKNERGEGFNLSRHTGKERPCARYWRARSPPDCSHPVPQKRMAICSLSWDDR